MRLILLFLFFILFLLYNNREDFKDIPAAVKKRFRDSNQNTAIINIDKDIQRRQAMLK